MGLAATALPVCLASCSDHWFRITEVSASSSESAILHVGVDGCAPSGAPPRVTETDSEIHLLVSQRHGGSELLCLSGFEVRLAHPVGSRKVFDERRHSVVPVTLALPIPMPAPSWLPHGWTLQQEVGALGNSESTYAAVASGPSVSIRLTSLADALERFRGSSVASTATVQGRSAIWAHPIDQPGASALIVHDEHWTLVVQDADSTSVTTRSNASPTV
jgi:hypothetical protein